jgi:hypothetical protein
LILQAILPLSPQSGGGGVGRFDDQVDQIVPLVHALGLFRLLLLHGRPSAACRLGCGGGGADKAGGAIDPATRPTEGQTLGQPGRCVTLETCSMNIFVAPAVFRARALLPGKADGLVCRAGPSISDIIGLRRERNLLVPQTI